MSQSEDFDSQMHKIQLTLTDLTSRNDELSRENMQLRSKIAADAAARTSSASQLSNSTASGASSTLESFPLSEDDIAIQCRDLEYKLGEARSKLARTQQSLEDQILARELVEKELEKERLMRMHSEKERDAYSAAYEASLKHFERWSKTKLTRESK
jgi:AmiR/NasT family two-component response regulator